MSLLRDVAGINEEIAARDNYHIIFPILINMGKTDGSIRKDLPADEIINNLRLYFNGISSSAVKSDHKNMYFSEIWADTMSRAAKDIRSDIKSLEDQWLERLYSTKSY